MTAPFGNCSKWVWETLLHSSLNQERVEPSRIPLRRSQAQGAQQSQQCIRTQVVEKPNPKSMRDHIWTSAQSTMTTCLLWAELILWVESGRVSLTSPPPVWHLVWNDLEFQTQQELWFSHMHPQLILHSSDSPIDVTQPFLPNNTI